MKALIDGDILVYRSAFAAEHTRYVLFVPPEDVDEEFITPAECEQLGRFDNKREMLDFIAEKGLSQGSYAFVTEREIEPVENALYSIKHTINRIKETLKTDDIEIYLSSGECFRHKKATMAKYKGNRDDKSKPVHYAACREYLIDVWGAKVFETIEADDALALNQGDDTCICSIDKDLMQIEGKHYNWVKEEKYLVKPRAALCRLWEQVLTGDSTDNIPGIRGIGPVKAKKMIAKCKSAMEMRSLCLDQWAEALAKEDGVQLLEGRPIDRIRPSEAVDEIYMLVKIGGDYAKEALNADK